VLLERCDRDVRAHPVLVIARIFQVFGILHRTGACVQQVATLRSEVARYPQMAIMDILPRDRSQVLIPRVLVDICAHQLPAYFIIKLPDFFLNFGHIASLSIGTVSYPSQLPLHVYLPVARFACQVLNVSPNIACPSPESTRSSDQVSSSFQKFNICQGNGQG